MNSEQQFMILAHNKSLITYLHDAIAHRNIAGGSVGYYIGGMKEAALKQSEGKKVIIATYAMASEGLDIKTLTSLILASPKTDVCQSVGRILRTKHSSPLVIDIIDEHDIFMSQWYKRRKYYKSQNYKILVCDNHEYNDGHSKDVSKWKVSWEPKKIQAAKPSSGQKSIAEQLALSLTLNLNHNHTVPVPKNQSGDDFEKEEEEHENKRKKGKGKSGLENKGCLLDVSSLFNE
jgi:superfamily II DNA or RNA helicase